MKCHITWFSKVWNWKFWGTQNLLFHIPFFSYKTDSFWGCSQLSFQDLSNEIKCSCLEINDIQKGHNLRGPWYLSLIMLSQSHSMEPVERISADSHNRPKKLYKLCLSIVLVVETWESAATSFNITTCKEHQCFVLNSKESSN